jgi:ABC-2 type transport system ATP-binding protein
VTGAAATDEAAAPAAPSDAREVVVRVKGLAKTFAVGFFRKRVDAVRGVDFEVKRGEIFGVLGPNGAGKTTTIKMLLGLVFPSAGEVSLFGKAAPGPGEMRRLGYLPENPYVYEYLRAPEFLDLCGRLCGLGPAERKKRTEETIAKVGLAHATDRPIGKFSKGMTQRIGLAQALLHDPELLILDEPMSGLDPIGRKEVRDLVLEEKQRGKTILFTSHILTDVEKLCDRVAIVNQGKVTAYGTLDTLLRPEVRRTEIELDGIGDEVRGELEALGATITVRRGSRVTVVVEGDEASGPIVARALAAGGRVTALQEQRETLEDLFVRKALRDHEQGDHGRG